MSTGCSEAPSGPKTELTKEEQQQVQELNEQRNKEWGNQ
jgi:hypothetical protein